MIADPVEAPRAEPLQPRLIKGFQAQYIAAEWPGRNTSRLKIYGKHVLVCVDKCSPASAGGALLPDEMIDRMTEASESGCLFAIGTAAFRHYEDGTRWGEADKPKVGERICFERYAGVRQVGFDGNIYRIMDYGAICAGEMTDEEA